MRNIPKLKVEFGLFFYTVTWNDKRTYWISPQLMAGCFILFFSFRPGVGPKKGKVTPLLIQHVSECWMTEHRCRALWSSGLDPDGRWWGDAEKRWSQVCDKSWFPPILPNHPHHPSLFQLFPPFKVWLWMSQWQIISPPQGRAGSHGRRRSRAWLCSSYFGNMLD